MATSLSMPGSPSTSAFEPPRVLQRASCNRRKASSTRSVSSVGGHREPGTGRLEPTPRLPGLLAEAGALAAQPRLVVEPLQRHRRRRGRKGRVDPGPLLPGQAPASTWGQSGSPPWPSNRIVPAPGAAASAGASAAATSGSRPGSASGLAGAASRAARTRCSDLPNPLGVSHMGAIPTSLSPS